MNEELSYLQQRLNQEVAMSAAATAPAVKHVHDALADAFYAKIMNARSKANVPLSELLD